MPVDDLVSKAAAATLRRGAACSLAVALLGATLLSGCDRGNAQEKKNAAPAVPEVGYVVLAPETVPLTVELSGRTSAFETSEVRPQVSGVITARLFTEGSVVHEGQTLYQIDPAVYQAAATQAAAELDGAIAARTAALARTERIARLAKEGIVSKQDLADAKAAAEQADAAVERARGQVQQARINLRFTKVPAPITGRIGRSLATTGALVNAGQAAPLAVIQRLDPIFVDIQQSSAELLQLRRSLESGGSAPAAADVRLTLEDGSAYSRPGALQFAESLVDPGTGTVTLRAKFENPEGLLLPGMYVRARITQSQAKGAILAPQQAISRDAKGNATAFVVAAGNKAELRTVRTERTVGDKWLVSAGLQPGDRLIVEGLTRVRPGQPVRPVQVDMRVAAVPDAAS